MLAINLHRLHYYSTAIPTTRDITANCIGATALRQHDRILLNVSFWFKIVFQESKTFWSKFFISGDRTVPEISLGCRMVECKSMSPQ